MTGFLSASAADLGERRVRTLVQIFAGRRNRRGEHEDRRHAEEGGKGDKEIADRFRRTRAAGAEVPSFGMVNGGVASPVPIRDLRNMDIVHPFLLLFLGFGLLVPILLNLLPKVNRFVYNIDMKIKFGSEWALRFGLGGLYLYSSYGLLTNPIEWSGFAPLAFQKFVSTLVPFETFLRLQGAVELCFAIGFLSWFLYPKTLKIIAGAAALEMLLILIFAGVNLVTFRDIGILSAAIALLLMPKED